VIDTSEIMAAFDEQLKRWGHVTVNHREWLLDWGGKEVLTALCRWLAGEFGDPLSGSDQWRPVDWTALTAQRQDRLKDIEIATALQSMLVRDFLAYLQNVPDSEACHEWTELMRAVHEAAQPRL
jgi:hypothetical protein